MAHFYGQLNGQRGPGASRLGSKSSGMKAKAAGWSGAGVVYASHDKGADSDVVTFALERHQGAGADRHLLTLRADGSDANPLHMLTQIMSQVEPDKRAATLKALRRDLAIKG